LANKAVASAVGQVLACVPVPVMLCCIRKDLHQNLCQETR